MERIKYYLYWYSRWIWYSIIGLPTSIRIKLFGIRPPPDD